MSGLPMIMVAPNGARRSKADHPELPVSAKELAKTARLCHAEGAGAIHLHIRDKQGRHSLSADRYREAISAISQSAPRMKIQITTESAGIFDAEAQFSCLRKLRPAHASVAVCEIARSARVANRLYAFAREAGTGIQHIIYGRSCLNQLLEWRKSGTISSDQNDVIFVLGSYWPPKDGNPDQIAVFLEAIDGFGLEWTVCAFGKREQQCLLRALQLGGRARVGFENNLHSPAGILWRDNSEAVHSLVAAQNKEP